MEHSELGGILLNPATSRTVALERKKYWNVNKYHTNKNYFSIQINKLISKFLLNDSYKGTNYLIISSIVSLSANQSLKERVCFCCLYTISVDSFWITCISILTKLEVP